MVAMGTEGLPDEEPTKKTLATEAGRDGNVSAMTLFVRPSALRDFVVSSCGTRDVQMCDARNKRLTVGTAEPVGCCEAATAR